MSTVLLIGSHEDPHVHLLARQVEALKFHALILDANSKSNFLTHKICAQNASILRAISSNGERIDLSKVISVWNRLKPLIPAPSAGPLETSSGEFAQREWKTVLQSLRMFLRDAKWVNDVDNQFKISSKPTQLQIARDLGFTIPDTVITNDPNEVLEMFAKHYRIIYKPLNGFVFPDQTGILTSEISKETVLDRQSNIKRAPGIYQNFIEKAYELRITVVGSEVFPALIRTPKTGLASIDWRHAHFESIFEKCTFEGRERTRLLDFHDAVGLRFAAYDFAVSQGGKLYFLEVNPAGQFLWLEQALGLQITKAIARHLCYPSVTTGA